MEYRKLGKTDLDVSVVGLGTWAMGDDFWGSVDDAESERTIRAAIDAGINLIDTAPAYGAGHAEEVVGRAIAGRRDEVVIATKVGVTRTPDAFIRDLALSTMRREIEDSLRRLKVETIDLYQVHWPDNKTPIADVIGELVKMRDAGKIRTIGVSNFSVQLLEEALAITEIASVQPHLSMLERGVTQSLMPFCAKRKIGVLGYGTLAGGLLTGKFREKPTLPEGDNRAAFYRGFRSENWDAIRNLLDVLERIASSHGATSAHVAINWSLAQRGSTSALVGAKSPAQAAANAKAAEWSLSEEELGQIGEALTGV